MLKFEHWFNLGNADAAAELRKEIGLMREKADFLAGQLKTKEDELRALKEKNGTIDSKARLQVTQKSFHI